MIKYNLICKDCELSFDSWFASSKEYEKLKRRGFLNCHNCNSKNIDKSLMAPKIVGKKKDDLISYKSDTKNLLKKIKEYQRFIKKNFEFVGKNFAYEARSIHFDNKKNKKGIYGTATKDEIKELKEEGIETELIPWVEDKSN